MKGHRGSHCLICCPFVGDRGLGGTGVYAMNARVLGNVYIYSVATLIFSFDVEVHAHCRAL